MHLKDAAGDVELDQTSPYLGLHCFLRSDCPNIKKFYGIVCINKNDALVNPHALRMTKTLLSFGRSECNRVKNECHSF